MRSGKRTTIAVRLTGVYALARLADEWEEQRQVCIDALCAYLRMPYQPDPNAEGYKEGEREVRHTIICVVGEHLQQPEVRISWSDCHFDFTGAILDGGDQAPLSVPAGPTPGWAVPRCGTAHPGTPSGGARNQGVAVARHCRRPSRSCGSLLLLRCASVDGQGGGHADGFAVQRREADRSGALQRRLDGPSAYARGWYRLWIPPVHRSVCE